MPSYPAQIPVPISFASLGRQALRDERVVVGPRRLAMSARRTVPADDATPPKFTVDLRLSEQARTLAWTDLWDRMLAGVHELLVDSDATSDKSQEAA